MGKKSRLLNRAARQAAVEPTLGNHSVPPAAPPGADYAGAGNLRSDALDALARCAARERRIQVERDRLVLSARRRGASWTDIARVLGVTPQAVGKRYGGRVDDE